MTIAREPDEGDDERTKAIKVIERMIARCQTSREEIDRAVFKIAYPLPPEI
jgi:hypothetical protein